MAKVQSIVINLYNKELGESQTVYANLGLKEAQLLKDSSEYGNHGLKNVVLETIEIDGKPVVLLKDFDLAGKETSEYAATIQKVKLIIDKKDGGTYPKEIVPFSENGKPLRAKDQALLGDIGRVAIMGLLGNKGMAHTDEGFYKGDVNVFIAPAWIPIDGTGKPVFEDPKAEGFTKITYVDKVDPREAKPALEFSNARQAERDSERAKAEVKDPAVADIDGVK